MLFTWFYQNKAWAVELYLEVEWWGAAINSSAPFIYIHSAGYNVCASELMGSQEVEEGMRMKQKENFRRWG